MAVNLGDAFSDPHVMEIFPCPHDTSQENFHSILAGEKQVHPVKIQLTNSDDLQDNASVDDFSWMKNLGFPGCSWEWDPRGIPKSIFSLEATVEITRWILLPTCAMMGAAGLSKSRLHWVYL